MMFDYRQLQALAAVLEEHSFERAAQRLFITQSAVSQRIRQLEERLGQVLVIRSTPIRATSAGQQLLKHYRQINQLQDELMEQLTNDPGQGSQWNCVAIGVNADSLATWFLEAIEPLLIHGKLLIELKVDDQDQTHDLLRTGEVIGCVSASAEPMQGCHCTALGAMVYRCLASPDFKARYFKTDPPASAFRSAPAVEFNHKDHLQRRFLETHCHVKPGTYPRHQIPSSEQFLNLVIRGHAWGMIPDPQSQSLLKAGKLVDLMPGRCLPVPLYWHAWNLQTDLNLRLTRSLVHVTAQLLSSTNT